MLDEGAKHHPQEWWWVKADGCDLVAGLAESMKGLWSGDIDLDDGDLQEQLKQYNDRLLSIQDLKFSDCTVLTSNLQSQFLLLKKDLEFLRQSKCLIKHNGYSSRNSFVIGCLCHVADGVAPSV